MATPLPLCSVWLKEVKFQAKRNAGRAQSMKEKTRALVAMEHITGRCGKRALSAIGRIAERKGWSLSGSKKKRRR